MQPDTYAPRLALHLAERARDAYKTDSVDGSIYISVNNHQCHVWILPDRIEIVGRGTEIDELADLCTDMDLDLDDRPGPNPSPLDGALVHPGIDAGAAALAEVVSVHVDAAHVRDRLAGRKPRPLVLGGHSLGGGLMLLMVRYLTRPDLCVAAVHVFGTPRVYTRHSAHEYPIPDRTWCHVHRADLIPRLPPKYVTQLVPRDLAERIGYDTVGHLVYLRRGAELALDPGIGRLAAAFMLRCPGGRLADHGIVHYIARLREAVADEA